MADTMNVNGMNDLLTAVKNSVQAINNLTVAVKSVFPQGVTVTNSVGAASGKYLTITAPDGNTYKLPLYNLS
jgi:hypothetical protein